eukprot:TRINITY_DN5170_c0_g1_i1.p1 TRINITY_DN5170_c0_g1~~TRINITY_DN5170_c0_g1_i1.p1  ORF type:complete len:918 (+),score=309.98 TRINITY_DN5170_c0_g1_i1:77-2830(+)
MVRTRETVDALRADNQLFSRNNAGFLRRLLHIASQKRETMWYVSKVMEDEKARGMLESAAPRDELQYYEGLMRRGGDAQDASPAPAEDIRVSDDHDAVDDDDDDDILSDHSDGSDHFESAANAALLHSLRYPTSPQAPLRRRPHTAGTLRPPRPGSASSTRVGKPPRARPSTATMGKKQLKLQRGPMKFDFTVASGRGAMPPPPQGGAESAPATPSRPPSAGTRRARGVLTHAVPRPTETPPEGCVPPSLQTRPKSAGVYKAKPVKQQHACGGAITTPVSRPLRPQTAPHNRIPINTEYRRRPSDVEHFKDQPKKVKLAAGLLPAEGEDKSIGHCWEEASGSLHVLRETVERVDVLMRDDKTQMTDEMRDKETAMDEEFALRDIGRLPDNEYVSDVSTDSSGRAGSGEDFARQKIQRQLARRNAKVAEKVACQNQALKQQHDLPYGVEERVAPEETPLVLNLKPGKIKHAPPLPAGEDATLSLSRKDELHGGSHIFAEKSDCSERVRRWRPCFDALTVVERSIMKMEKAWKRMSTDKGEEQLDHPPVVSERDKETFLSEGLGQENDEISGVLTLWANDLQQRLKVLDTYERIQTQGKVSDIDHAACQTEDTYEGGGARAKRKSSAASPQVVNANASLLTREATSAFQFAMIRVTAAIRVQSMWRAYHSRRMVGNSSTGLMTFFHSRDPRIREAWTQCAYFPPGKPVSWLSTLLSNLLNSKITANYIADSQRAPHATFTNYVFEYLYESLQDEHVVYETLHQMLVLLNCHVNDDLLFAIVCNLLFCTWGPGHADLLAYSMCCVHATVNKLTEINTTKPNCVVDQDVYLTSAQIKAVVKSVFNSKASMKANALHEEVHRRCRVLEGNRRTKGQAGDGGDAGKSTGVTVTQKEMLYAILISATPDVLVDFGYETRKEAEE